MINIIKNWIKACNTQILTFENKTPETDLERMYNKGILEGLRSELEALNALLVSAIDLERRNKSA